MASLKRKEPHGNCPQTEGNHSPQAPGRTHRPLESYSAPEVVWMYLSVTTRGDVSLEYQALNALAKYFFATSAHFSNEHFSEVLGIVYADLPKHQTGPLCPRAKLRRACRAIFAVRLPWGHSENKLAFELLLQQCLHVGGTDFCIDKTCSQSLEEGRRVNAGDDRSGVLAQGR
ncbi:hypothetical protein EJ03DRAFT_335529 [Teratosphaeria nubilosa]|uniref:Uncharacterized protein n=1 Tax=Teratosphaeria nubilosa TaxID=161662 RepID=A0A6G1LCK3_9PEZI|nr:hypothetical protein EJ03DRAFT_335529 [Teratosphaeria nubilosa]